jgi:hypothetical protein|tara:strand:- start:59 stop:814 length:756 start_codon:yes stop_codon:yes gene_type:complete
MIRGTLLDMIREKFFSPENRSINGAIDKDEYKKQKELQVNMEFLRKSEGFETEGYVPRSGEQVLDSSGVTIGTGLDLGTKNMDYFKDFENKETLKKMEAYFGMQGQEAYDFEQANPLSLTREEAIELDNFVKGRELGSIENSFLALTGKELSSMPPRLQTVIADLQFQYGSNYNRTPKFRDIIKDIAEDPQDAQSYMPLMNELRDFGDKYDTRREREADLIQELYLNLLPTAKDLLRDDSTGTNSTLEYRP